MATSTLEFLILAKDQASEAFEKVGDAVEKSGSKIDKMKAASGVALAAVGAGVLAFGKSSVDAFEEAEQSQAKLEDAYSRFPGMANVSIDALRKLNSEIQRKTGYDDDDLAAGEAALAQYGLTGDQIQKLTPLVADFAAKTGTDLNTAFEQVGKSMLGQGKALKGVGIDFKDAGDVAGNFAQVVDGLTSKVGGFGEKAGDTAAGKSRILATEFENLKETVGGALSPALEKLVSVATKVLDWLQNTPGAMQGVAIALGVMAAAWLAMTVAASPWLLIGAAIAAVIAGVILAVKNWGAISSWFSGVWNGALNAVKGWFSGAADWISDKWNGLIGWFKKVPGYIGDALADVVKFVTAPFRLAFDAVASLWNRSIGGLSFTVPDWVPGIGGKGITLPNLPMLATGGYIQQGGLAIVGERGPELVSLPTGATVHPNGSGAGTVFNIYETVSAEATAKQVIRLSKGLAV